MKLPHIHMPTARDACKLAEIALGDDARNATADLATVETRWGARTYLTVSTLTAAFTQLVCECAIDGAWGIRFAGLESALGTALFWANRNNEPNAEVETRPAMLAINRGQYPEREAPVDASTSTLKAIADDIACVSDHASSDRTRATQYGISLATRDGRALFVATDGYTCAEQVSAVSAYGVRPEGLLIPFDSISAIKRLAREKSMRETPVWLSYDEQRIRVCWANGHLALPVDMENMSFALDRIGYGGERDKKRLRATVTCDLKALVNAAKLIGLDGAEIATVETLKLECDTRETQLVLRAHGKSAKVAVHPTAGDKPTRAEFAADYLWRSIRKLRGSEATLRMGDDTSPLEIIGKGCRTLTMPRKS